MLSWFGLAVALSFLIGVSLGLLGSGGSIITLPVLVYVAGVPAHSAVGMSLVVVGVSSLVGLLIAMGQGQVDLKATVTLGIAGMIGAYPGAHLTRLVSPAMLMFLFACLMLVIGARMLLGNPSAARRRSLSTPNVALVGMGIGFLTGFLGVGGGFLIVPALVLLMGLDMRKAASSSLAIIALNSLSGFVGHASQAPLDWPITLELLMAAVAGMVGASLLAGRIPDRVLRYAFAWFVLLFGGLMVVVNAAKAIHYLT